jgi:hypothetical protein
MRHAQMKPQEIAKPTDVEPWRCGNILALKIVSRWFRAHFFVLASPSFITIKISRLVNIRIAAVGNISTRSIERSGLPRSASCIPSKKY